MVIVLHCSIGYVHMCAYTSTPNIYTYIMYIGLFSLCMAKTTGNCLCLEQNRLPAVNTVTYFSSCMKSTIVTRQGTNNAHPLVILSHLQTNVSHIIIGLPSCPTCTVFDEWNVTNMVGSICLLQPVPILGWACTECAIISSLYCYTIWITWPTKLQ